MIPKFEDSHFTHYRTELVSLSNEYMYFFKEIVYLKKDEYCMNKLYQFIVLFRKVILLGLLPKEQANSIAGNTEDLVMVFPDLEDQYLNRLKTLAAEEAIKIFNYTSQH